jgi:hypothetical protein
MQVWTTINDKIYLLSYNAEGSEFQKNLPVVEQILTITITIATDNCI